MPLVIALLDLAAIGLPAPAEAIEPSQPAAADEQGGNANLA
jgi:hypothetical protein